MDLEAVKAKFLKECGPHDYGVAAPCTCPVADFRPVMLELVREVEGLRQAREECDALRVGIQAIHDDMTAAPDLTPHYVVTRRLGRLLDRTSITGE